MPRSSASTSSSNTHATSNGSGPVGDAAGVWTSLPVTTPLTLPVFPSETAFSQVAQPCTQRQCRVKKREACNSDRCILTRGTISDSCHSLHFLFQSVCVCVYLRVCVGVCGCVSGDEANCITDLTQFCVGGVCAPDYVHFSQSSRRGGGCCNN
jgi:hypothetical protein